MTMKPSRHACLLAALLLLPACEAPETETEAVPADEMAGAAAPAPASVNELREAYVQAYNADDMAGVADLYAEDAVLISPAGVAHGQAAIREALAADTAAAEAEVMSSGVATAGGLTYDWGTYTIRGLPDVPGGEARGDYLAINKLENGETKLVALMTGQPQAPAEPGAEAAAELPVTDSVRDAFVAAYNAGDLATVADLYASDGVLINATGVHRGPAAIQQGLLAGGAEGAELAVTPLGESEVGGASWGWGTYRVSNVPNAPGGELSGYYVIVLDAQGEIVAHMSGSPRQVQQMQELAQQQ